jgi:nitric oxide reductase NorD protein
VREASEDEDDAAPGVFMVQTSQPHEHAEDPMGAQRPTDRDSEGAAESHAESLADLAEARLVRSAQPAHEVLLSDDPPLVIQDPAAWREARTGGGLRYPEWDYRLAGYRDPGTTVFESVAAPGPAAWVDRILVRQSAMLRRIQRQFEMLRAQRVTLHRQDEGDEIDIDACIAARADARAGAGSPQRLYQRTRLARRDTAVLVLVDVSGSTDAWLAGQRRIIDVEREALLPLSIALAGTGDQYAILAFSGEGPQGVQVRSVKRFDEPHGREVALRIAGLEPERYTRAGAALRHASSLLVKRPARHRLLLLLSDGKPNDCDVYEGRYGVEDMRQAVLEARQAGLSTFCLTVDRQAGAYLPRVFGPHHYALLQQPELLPVVLLEWMKRLLAQ